VIPVRVSEQRAYEVTSIVQSIYVDSQLGEPTDLQPAGTGLENPYVYDSAARELKAMANRGLVRIVGEHVRTGSQESLIDRITFARLR